MRIADPDNKADQPDHQDHERDPPQDVDGEYPASRDLHTAPALTGTAVVLH